MSHGSAHLAGGSSRDEPLQVQAGETSDAAVEDPTEEVNKSRPKRHPGDSTKAERDALNLTHANYKAWCAICSRAALKEDPRYRETRGELSNGHPCISFDYKTIGGVR